jgi:HEAT repeat protein
MIEYDEPFESLLEGLRDPDTPLRAALIYRLSQPSEEEMTALAAIWADIPVARRQLLLTRLLELSEVSIEVDFGDVAIFALKDPDPGVRSRAIELMWEDERIPTMRRIIRILQTDESADVRATAAQALGRFVLAGELGEMSALAAQEAEDALQEIWFELAEPPEVRRRALESIAYSGRDEVSSMIEEALQHPEQSMLASAIFAMGRSADEVWEPYVLEALHHPEAELRFEAARAAGELFLITAVSHLVDMLEEADREIREAAVWALGEIGGDAAQRALMRLADDDSLDDAMLDAVEDALNTAALSTGEFATYIFTRGDPTSEAFTREVSDLGDLSDVMDLDEDELSDEDQLLI